MLLIFLTTKSHASLVFINEIHYDNNGADVNEFVELAGSSGTNLLGWSLVFYNGLANSDGLYIDYNTYTFTDALLTDEGNGYGFKSTMVSGIQNGSPDGIALVDNLSQLVQFISYEGDFVASTGAAAGVRSENISVVENSNTPENWSLQLVGFGSKYSDFSWSSGEQSSGSINYLQGFVPRDQSTAEVNEPNTFLLFLFISLGLTANNRNKFLSGKTVLIPTSSKLNFLDVC